MSIGSSGRIVIEVEPELKRQLYAALAKEGMSLKEWFLRSADAYLNEGGQISLPLPKRNDPNRTQQPAEHDALRKA